MAGVGPRCVLSGVLAVLSTMGGLRVTVSPNSALGSSVGSGPGNTTSNVVTMTVEPPLAFTPSWVLDSGDASIVVLAPGGSSTAFRALLDENSSTFAYYRARATVNGVNYDSDPFFVQLSRFVP